MTKIFDQTEAASYLKLPESTLAFDRATKSLGIPYLKLGRRVRYSQAMLDDWLQSRVKQDQEAV